MRRYLAPALFGLALFIAGRCSAPDPPVRYPAVVVSEEALTEEEPTPEPPTITERIVYRDRPAEQTAVAPDAGQPDVDSFCAEAVQRVRHELAAAGEGSKPPPPKPDPRLLVRSWTYDGRDLEVWGPRSDGDLWRGSYRARPPYTVRADGDSLIVRSARFWWVDDALRAGAYIGGGYLLGRLVP